MSVTKTQATQYHETEQPVKFKLNWLRLDNLDKLKSLSVRGGFRGCVGNTDGEVDKKEAGFQLQDVKDNFTAAEKQAAKAFIAACERVIALKNSDLTEETHDDSDVFEEPAEEPEE